MSNSSIKLEAKVVILSHEGKKFWLKVINIGTNKVFSNMCGTCNRFLH